MRPLQPVNEVVPQDTDRVARGELEVVAGGEREAEVLPPPSGAEVQPGVRQLAEAVQLLRRQRFRAEDRVVLMHLLPVELGNLAGLPQLLVQLRARIRGEDVELRPVREGPQSELDRVDRALPRLAWEAEDERAVRLDARILRPPDRLRGLLDGRLLAHAVEDPLVARFDAERDAAASRRTHRGEKLGVDEVDAGVAVPADVEALALDAIADLAHAPLVHRERLVEERHGPDSEAVREVPKLLEDAVRGPEPPRGACDRAEGARVGASLARVHDREGLACGRGDEVRIERWEEIVRRDGQRIVVLDRPRVRRDADVAVVAVRETGDAVERHAALQRVDQGRPDALVLVAEVDI